MMKSYSFDVILIHSMSNMIETMHIYIYIFVYKSTNIYIYIIPLNLCDIQNKNLCSCIHVVLCVRNSIVTSTSYTHKRKHACVIAPSTQTSGIQNTANHNSNTKCDTVHGRNPAPPGMYKTV